MKSAVVFCNGVIDDYEYLKKMSFDDKLLICADGGLRHVRAIGLVPDVIIGDNDSWKEEYTDCAEVIKHKPEKDLTDTNLCVDYAIDHGYKDIVIIGGFGGRVDHEFSHYCLLAYGLSKGVRVRMVDKSNEVFMTNRSFVLDRGERKYVSFFPYGGDVEGFSVHGLKYSAENILLSCGRVQATSNEFSESEKVKVSFKSGLILVMLCDDVGCLNE